MSGLSGHVEDYLRLRRALGFKLERAGHLLPQLVAYLEAAGAADGHHRAGDRLGAAARSTPARTTGPHRLAVVRGFARYLQTHRPGHRGPAGRRVPRPRATARRPTCGPSATSAGCSHGARALRPPLRAATYEALFGLLAVSGMRVGEAVGLDRDDVDLAGRGHHHPPREVRPAPAGPAAPHGHGRPVAPTPPSATASARDPARRRSSSPCAGTRLDRSGVAKTLRQITTAHRAAHRDRPSRGAHDLQAQLRRPTP